MMLNQLFSPSRVTRMLWVSKRPFPEPPEVWVVTVSDPVDRGPIRNLLRPHKSFVLDSPELRGVVARMHELDDAHLLSDEALHGSVEPVWELAHKNRQLRSKSVIAATVSAMKRALEPAEKQFSNLEKHSIEMLNNMHKRD